jgi:hypothetical protein
LEVAGVIAGIIAVMIATIMMIEIAVNVKEEKLSGLDLEKAVEMLHVVGAMNLMIVTKTERAECLQK